MIMKESALLEDNIAAACLHYRIWLLRTESMIADHNRIFLIAKNASCLSKQRESSCQKYFATNRPIAEPKYDPTPRHDFYSIATGRTGRCYPSGIHRQGNYMLSTHAQKWLF
jgi:hypothetical protein